MNQLAKVTDLDKKTRLWIWEIIARKRNFHNPPDWILNILKLSKENEDDSSSDWTITSEEDEVVGNSFNDDDEDMDDNDITNNKLPLSSPWKNSSDDEEEDDMIIDEEEDEDEDEDMSQVEDEANASACSPRKPSIKRRTDEVTNEEFKVAEDEYRTNTKREKKKKN